MSLNTPGTFLFFAIIQMCQEGSWISGERLQSHILSLNHSTDAVIERLYLAPLDWIGSNLTISHIKALNEITARSHTCTINIHSHTCILSLNTTMQFLSVAFASLNTDSMTKIYIYIYFSPCEITFCYNLICRTRGKPCLSCAFSVNMQSEIHKIAFHISHLEWCESGLYSVSTQVLFP